jgi:hypothetical protein
MQTQRRMGGVYGRISDGQEMRPRKSHRRGNDALPRGLEPENEGTRASLGRLLRNSLTDPVAGHRTSVSTRFPVGEPSGGGRFPPNP